MSDNTDGKENIVYTKNTLDPAKLPHYMDAKQVAVLLDLAPQTVRKMAAHGELPAYKVGKKLWRFRKNEILDSKRWEAQTNGQT